MGVVYKFHIQVFAYIYMCDAAARWCDVYTDAAR